MKKSKRKVLIPVYPTENVFEFEDISSSLKKYKIPTERPVRIYCDGVYDLFHYGHANSLEQAKNLFPNVHLLVGVTADKITNELKGSTVFNEVERAESLRHCRHVDEVITNAPWIITDEFLEKHKIDYVAHDESPYKFNNIDDIYKHLKEKNMFIPIKRTKGISTSGIITKIVRDYDKYVRRNLERGETAKELNISFLQFNKFKMAKQFKNLMKNVDFQSRLDEIRMELTIATKFWERVSNELIVSFLAKFNRVSQRNRQFNIIDKILEFVKSKTR